MYWLAEQKTTEISWRPLLILVSCRTGLEKLNKVYLPHLQWLLRNEYYSTCFSSHFWRCCAGIIGGKPGASLFFVGWQGTPFWKETLNHDRLWYYLFRPTLRPGCCQTQFGSDSKNAWCSFPSLISNILETYSCKAPLKMPMIAIDPTLTVGLLFETKKKFLEFHLSHKEFENTSNPLIFEIAAIPVELFAKLAWRINSGVTCTLDGHRSRSCSCLPSIKEGAWCVFLSVFKHISWGKEASWWLWNYFWSIPRLPCEGPQFVDFFLTW